MRRCCGSSPSNATLLCSIGAATRRRHSLRVVADETPTCQACGLPFELECTVVTVDIAGKTYQRVPLGSETPGWWLGRQPAVECHDCSARIGQRHHFMCDMEQCPRCGGQFLTCECPDT